MVEATPISINGRCFFWWLGASFNTIFFFSHLFRVISPDNLSPYHGTLFLLSDFLRHAVCDDNPVNDFPTQSVTLKRRTCSTWVVFTDKHFHRYSQFSNVNSPLLKWKEMIDSSSRGWSFLFWTFHIWYKAMNNTCYILSPLFLFHCFSQVATNFTFTSETSLILLLLKCLRSHATKKSLVKIVEHKLEETFSDSIRDVQLGRFILLSVPISEQFPRLTSLSFFSFLNWPFKHNCTFRWQHSGDFEHLTTLESWKLFSCKYQVTEHPSCSFCPSYLPINLCSFHWVPGLYNYDR